MGHMQQKVAGMTLETPEEEDGLISRVEDLHDGRWKSVEHCVT